MAGAAGQMPTDSGGNLITLGLGFSALVKIELGGRTIPVTAEQLHGADREQAWRQITTAASRFATYQRKTDRELPITRLTPRSG